MRAYFKAFLTFLCELFNKHLKNAQIYVTEMLLHLFFEKLRLSSS